MMIVRKAAATAMAAGTSYTPSMMAWTDRTRIQPPVKKMMRDTMMAEMLSALPCPYGCDSSKGRLPMRRAIMLDPRAMKSAALSMPSAKTASDLPK